MKNLYVINYYKNHSKGRQLIICDANNNIKCIINKNNYVVSMVLNHTIILWCNDGLLSINVTETDKLTIGRSLVI